MLAQVFSILNGEGRRKHAQTHKMQISDVTCDRDIELNNFAFIMLRHAHDRPIMEA